MNYKVLIIGGAGRIGQAIAHDLQQHTQAQITITGRTPKIQSLGLRTTFHALDLADREAVIQSIQAHQLVIHCAGPFRDRDYHVLQTCIQYRIPYIDVADSPDYVKGALKHHPSAIYNDTIAVLSTGVFPGISCSMARRCVEQLDQAQEIHLSYLVAGSGGAGVTVMRTTFTELQTPFQCKQNGRLHTIRPYSVRETLDFPVLGKRGVYWFNTVEAQTLVDSFPQVQSITTKFGSVPDLYNYLTGLVTKAPSSWIQNPTVIEFLSQVSYKMTQISDRFSGIGLAIRATVTGLKNEQVYQSLSTFYCEDTALCAGQGAGMIAELILQQKLLNPGVWPVEKILSTPLFEAALSKRGLKLDSWMTTL